MQHSTAQQCATWAACQWCIHRCLLQDICLSLLFAAVTAGRLLRDSAASMCLWLAEACSIRVLAGLLAPFQLQGVSPKLPLTCQGSRHTSHTENSMNALQLLASRLTCLHRARMPVAFISWPVRSHSLCQGTQNIPHYVRPPPPTAWILSQPAHGAAPAGGGDLNQPARQVHAGREANPSCSKWSCTSATWP